MAVRGLLLHWPTMTQKAFNGGLEHSRKLRIRPVSGSQQKRRIVEDWTSLRLRLELNWQYSMHGEAMPPSAPCDPKKEGSRS